MAVGWTGSQALLGELFFPGRLRSLFSFIPPPQHTPLPLLFWCLSPRETKFAQMLFPPERQKLPPLFPSSFGFMVMCPMTKQAQICAQSALPFSLKGESFSRAGAWGQTAIIQRCLSDGRKVNADFVYAVKAACAKTWGAMLVG